MTCWWEGSVSLDLLDLPAPAWWLLYQMEETRGAEMLVFEATLFLPWKLMSRYLGDVIPFSQMARTLNLLSNAAGIAQHFKSCGWKMKQVGSDRWAE